MEIVYELSSIKSPYFSVFFLPFLFSSIIPLVGIRAVASLAVSNFDVL